MRDRTHVCGTCEAAVLGPVESLLGDEYIMRCHAHPPTCDGWPRVAYYDWCWEFRRDPSPGPTLTVREASVSERDAMTSGSGPGGDLRHRD